MSLLKLNFIKLQNLKLKNFQLLIFLFMVCGCNYQMAKTASLNDSNNFLSSDQIITFDLIQSYSLVSCKSCHAGNKSPQLISRTDLQSHADLILNVIATNAMPPASKGYEPLTLCKKALLKKWIELGSPNESTVTVGQIADCKNENHQPNLPVLPIALMPLNYETLKTRILQPKCLLCHAAGGEQSDLPFFPYKDLMMMDRLWKAPAETSKVFAEISNKEDGMPPPESKLTSLTDEEIDFVKRWIDAGNPEN